MNGAESTRVREAVGRMRARLGMTTLGSTFEESVALVVGYQLGVGINFLDGYRDWLVRRQPDRAFSEWAFPGLVLVEVTNDPRWSLRTDPDINARCVGHLFDTLDQYLVACEAGEEGQTSGAAT